MNHIVIETPCPEELITTLEVGDVISISGYIFTGRDAVLPKIVNAAAEGRLSELGINLQGSVIFHTAVSPAGVGPTSSNKVEIHLGKGAISPATVQALEENNAVFAVIPPVTALLESQTLEREVVAFPELGMEAFHRIRVENYQAIVAAAHGESIYD